MAMAEKKRRLVVGISGATGIAYETVQAADGSLPLLKPMSEVAGRMSIHAGANCLEKAKGGRGVLIGGVPGVAPADVVIIGGGVVGMQAARMAASSTIGKTVLWAGGLGLLGLIFGSFLSTVAVRAPEGRSAARGRSACENSRPVACSQPIQVNNDIYFEITHHFCDFGILFVSDQTVLSYPIFGTFSTGMLFSSRMSLLTSFMIS